MPDEHGGVVKENYLWKVPYSACSGDMYIHVYYCVCVHIHIDTCATCYCGCELHIICSFVPSQVLLHRSAGEEGRFLSVKSSEFDQDLFLLSWGPTVAALSYVFDKADEKSIVQRAVDGFRYNVIYKNDSQTPKEQIEC